MRTRGSIVPFERFVHLAHIGDFVMASASGAVADLEPEWVDARTAAKILRVPDARNVQRLVRAGRIKTRDLPGVRAIYSRADVEDLARDGYGGAPGYSFELRSDEGARLIPALIEYRQTRDRWRADGSLNEKEWALPRFRAAMGPICLIGQLAMHLVKRALDRDADAFLKALDGPDQHVDDDGDWTKKAFRFWETLAHLQAEESASQSTASYSNGAELEPGTAKPSE
jgi:hypothetical protein